MALSRWFTGCPAVSAAVIGLLLLLQGCALFPTVEPTAVLAAVPVSDAASSPLVAWASMQSPDRYADAILDDPAFGENVSVRIDSYYLSALGQSCRRVRVSVVVNGPPAETVAVCRNDDGNWFLAPRIWKGALAGNHR